MNCRHCATLLAHCILDLGTAPPSNAYLTAEQLPAPERWYPLRLLLCTNCGLVQTEDFLEREALFTPDYAYMSSVSSSWLAHCRAYVEEAVHRFGLGADSLVVEIASNDGYLLQYVRAAGIPCFGIEPTAACAAAARGRGIDTVEAFFGLDLARQLAQAGRQADLVVANNVLAHVPDINDFVAGVAALLRPGGVASFEFPHLVSLVAGRQFDTVYHEHYSYLSLTTVGRVFAANGLVLFDAEEIPTHGGSLRVFAQRADTPAPRPVTPRTEEILGREAALEVTTPAFFAALQVQAEGIKNDVLAFLLDAKRRGKKVAAYGAAAKGNTLLNFAGIRRDLLPYVVDRNPAKQGKYLPGSRIPIVAEERLQQDQPEYIVILPWNLREEVMAQLEYAQAWGAVFVTAVPQMRSYT